MYWLRTHSDWAVLWDGESARRTWRERREGGGLVARLPLLILLLGASLAAAQSPTKPKEGEEDKVSNDNPGRPLQMPPASSEVKEAFDDFDRFRRRGAWERAFKAIDAIPEPQAARFVDGESGFIIPAARKRRQELAGLSPAGQSAYRLFHDAEAKKLVDEAEGTDELKDLERAYSAFFTTTVGDNAADRLGDLYFELGRFDRAADCWLSVVRDRPDTDLSPALLTLKAALALGRSGRWAEVDHLRDDLEDRYRDELVTLGGETGPAAALLRKWAGDRGEAGDDPGRETASASAEPSIDLGGPVEPLWQVRFADSVEAGMVPVERTQWESHPLSAVVPATAIGGSSLFVNQLGFGFGVDLRTGKLLWRTEPLHHLKLLTTQDQTRGIDATRFAAVATDDYVINLGRDLKEANLAAPHTLTCLRAEGGEVVWKSPDLADYAQLDMNGPPIAADGTFYVAAKSQQVPGMARGLPQQFVLAIRPYDGKVLWKAEIGTFRQGQRYYFSSYSRAEPDPQPRLIQQGGTLYVDTHVGVLARLDAEAGGLDWGYGYQTAPYQSTSHFFFYDDMPQESVASGGPPIRMGGAFLIKGMQSSRISAVDPDRMTVLWDRPMAKSARLLGVGQGAAFLGGDEISALDLETRKLRWATRLPGGSLRAGVVVRPDGIWQLTPRGIFEIDPSTGEVRRIFRGADLGSVGGDLLLTDELLLAVSNRTITAYPRSPANEDRSP